MTTTRQEILQKLQAHIRVQGHVVGAVAGCGLTAKCAELSNVNFVLGLAAGHYRIMGRGSLASYMPFNNNNEMVMNMGKKELLPILRKTPILFGFMASDPTINITEYLQEIKTQGFAGIVNYPTVELIDGSFRTGLERAGLGYDCEVQAIKQAHLLDMLTVAFVGNAKQAKQMLYAGADIICVHLGLTHGGITGAREYLPMSIARNLANEIFQICDEINPNVIKMIYAGTRNTSFDMNYLYQNTSCQGYIGGSALDRIPIEKSVIKALQDFTGEGYYGENSKILQYILSSDTNDKNYAEFVKNHIENHYMDVVRLDDLALVVHVAPSYLSTQFKNSYGCSFTEYLVRFRVNKAKEFIKNGVSCAEAAVKVGYTDYAQFSKMFKKYIGKTPAYYLKK